MIQKSKNNDIDTHQNLYLNSIKKIDTNHIVCRKCGSQFFESVKVCKYKEDHQTILGQEVPVKVGAIPFVFLRCIRCNELIEPHILYYARDTLGGDYVELLDTLDGKNDQRMDNQKVLQNEIQSEKL